MNLRRRSTRIGMIGAVIAVIGIALAFFGDSVTPVDPPAALITVLWPLTKVWLSFGMPLAAGLICVGVALAPHDRPDHPSKNAAAARAR